MTNAASVDKCHLHIPHKDWATRAGLDGGKKEEENLQRIEQWARYYYENCGGCPSIAWNLYNNTAVADFDNGDGGAVLLSAGGIERYACGPIHTVTVDSTTDYFGAYIESPGVYHVSAMATISPNPEWDEVGAQDENRANVTLTPTVNEVGSIAWIDQRTLDLLLNPDDPVEVTKMGGAQLRSNFDVLLEAGDVVSLFVSVKGGDISVTWAELWLHRVHCSCSETVGGGGGGGGE